MPATVAKGCPTCGLVSFTFSATDSSSLYVMMVRRLLKSCAMPAGQPYFHCTGSSDSAALSALHRGFVKRMHSRRLPKSMRQRGASIGIVCPPVFREVRYELKGRCAEAGTHLRPG
jgi:hypothetical protein